MNARASGRLPLLFILASLFAGDLIATSRPNVIFLLADDMRADVIAALGNSHVQTPNLDRLVARGTSFTRAYIMGGLQGAVCVPSRAMMLSGRPLFRISEHLKETTTWPMVFRAAGYETFGCGKWHNGGPSYAASFPNGKTVFLGGMSDHFRVAVRDVTAGGTLTPPRTNTVHSSELFAGQAIEFLRAQKGGTNPFALYVAFTAPHDPRQAPKEFRARYDAAKLALPKNFLPKHPFNNGELTVRDEQLLPWPRTEAAVRNELADYYAILTHLDTQIGRVLETLREIGRAEETIVVFAADNGLALGSHGLLGKQNVYEHSMRVPLIVSGPGLPADRRTAAMCYLFDLFPTLCDMAGLKTPASVQGRSLMAVLKGEKEDHRDAILTAYRHYQRAVNDGHFKLIRYAHINKTQLFDLQNDPQELRDLSADAAAKPRLDGLMARLTVLQKEFGDGLALTTDSPAPLEIPLPPVGKKSKKTGK
jgi:arylsulfatase A-like enzyme